MEQERTLTPAWGAGTRYPIGVVVVAQTRLYREGLVSLLARQGPIHLFGSAADPDEGLGLATREGADIVLLDSGAASGPAALRRMVQALPNTRVVVFGIAESEEVVIRYAEAGVSGYVPHDATLTDLLAVLEGAVRDELVCSSRLAGTLLRRVGALAQERDPVASPDPLRLTPRETQIVSLIDEGLSNKEIAARLYIGLSTVKNHVHNILDKLGVRRRSEAAARVRAFRRTG